MLNFIRSPSSVPLRAVGPAVLIVAACASQALGGFTNNILITGYWPPTNEMIRRFSTNPEQNPTGWIGKNWENRGYDIHSFFPEFPGGTDVNPKGNGDLEVDYQDTSADWWRITDMIKPVAIITFSRGSSGSNWEVEYRAKNRTAWVSDYVIPLKPTPAPPDASVPAETIRYSTLPMTQIRDAVNNANLGISAFIDMNSQSLGGAFLSEFIGYHGSWYQSIHASPDDPFQTFAAGHIHVGIQTPLESAKTATDISLRELITHVNTLIPEPSCALAPLGVCAMLRRRRAS
jgi:hypothetical protein